MYAITPQAQDTTAGPSFGFQTLRTVLAELQAAHPERGSRLDHAAMIVALRQIEQAMAGPGAWWVQSESDPTTEYYVVALPSGRYSCTCKDYQQRGGPCKHGLAVVLRAACEDRERGDTPPPTPLAFPTRCYGDEDRFELTVAGAAYLAALDAPVPAA
jgi:hypothetical protein